MKGDFTRDTFDPAKQFSRVLMQQGRVTLDADFNEQAAILLHYIRTLATDLIGPYAAPAFNGGFQLSFDKKNNDLVISQGRYYVDGILVENEGMPNDQPTYYSQQPNCLLPADDPLLAELKSPTGGVFWAYLDVWERHITFIEDDAIREKALNGPDTCTRAKVVWQVRALPASKLPDPGILPGGATVISCSAPMGLLTSVSKALMAARINPGAKTQDACVTPPDSKYRGVENQLYRVEIHTPGTAATGAAFKWSRDNGSNASAWLSTTGNDIKVVRGTGFSAGNWIELTDDTKELSGLPGLLVKLSKVEGHTLTVDPASIPDPSALVLSDLFVNPKVRRWDQISDTGAVPIVEQSPAANAWIPLEDELQIQFSQNGQYITGDYWLIPARVTTGSIEWPPLTDATGEPVIKDGVVVPDALPPDGIEHHYAPLGFFSLDGRAGFTFGTCRCTFEPASTCFRAPNVTPDKPLTRPVNFEARLLSEEAVEESAAAPLVKKRKK